MSTNIVMVEDILAHANYSSLLGKAAGVADASHPSISPRAAYHAF